MFFEPSREDFPDLTDDEFEQYLEDFEWDLENRPDIYLEDYLLENWIE